jgi:multimeric flavodoxin WrbA
MDLVVFYCVTSETVLSHGKRYIINDITRNRLKNCIDKIQMCHTLIASSNTYLINVSDVTQQYTTSLLICII